MLQDRQTYLKEGLYMFNLECNILYEKNVDWIVYFYLMLDWIYYGAIWHVIVLFSPIFLSGLLCFKSMVLHAQVGGTIIGNTASSIKWAKWLSQSIQKLIPLKYCPSIATKVWLLFIYLPRSSLRHKVEAKAPVVPLLLQKSWPGGTDHLCMIFA